jgi:glutamyl-tRNA synthetase
LLIERDDAATIQVGNKVTLIKWGNCTITKRLEEDGKVHLFGTIDELDKDFKGTAKIHWVSADPSATIKVKIVEYDHLITEPKIEEDTNVADIVNHNSKIEYTAIAEGCLRRLQKGDIFQFERRGFYFVD